MALIVTVETVPGSTTQRLTVESEPHPEGRFLKLVLEIDRPAPEWFTFLEGLGVHLTCPPIVH